MLPVAATAGRRVASQAVRRQQCRHMGGGGGPKPEWEGIDKVVRTYFPEDYQLAGAILGGYGGLIALAVLRSKMKGSPPPAAEPAASLGEAPATTTGVPAVDSPEFEKFVESDAFTNMIENEEQLLQWVESAEK